MTRTGSMAFLGVLGVSVVTVAAQGANPKDDLALVKRAVAQNTVAPAPTQAAEVAPRASPSHGEPHWFKVRVIDKATGKKKVSVNMPLSLVKALGEDVPVDIPCGEGRLHSTLRIGEVLAALESGQDLVQVDDEDSEVRVWVE